MNVHSCFISQPVSHVFLCWIQFQFHITIYPSVQFQCVYSNSTLRKRFTPNHGSLSSIARVLFGEQATLSSTLGTLFLSMSRCLRIKGEGFLTGMWGVSKYVVDGRNPANHLGCIRIKPCKSWDCQLVQDFWTINSMTSNCTTYEN